MSRLTIGLVVGAAGTMLIGAPLAVAGAGMFTASTPVPVSCGRPAAVATVAPGQVAGFNQEQVVNATVIVQTGQRLGVPPRGWVVAVATSMQESRLHNLGHLGQRNDHDSLGLFQQRPSQGWGTVEQVTDPAYAATQFYQRLVKVPGWVGLPLTVAAQKVQRSAFPNAYAKHEPAAARLVDAVTGGAAGASGSGSGECAKPDEVTASGWVAPVPGGPVSGFRTGSRPTHQGVDLAGKHRTPIRAASAGTVIKALCDAGTLRTVGTCDRDGSPSARGCGWYVDVRHAGGVITRYCHMIERPAVAAGDTVVAGQRIGLVGSSGHSSGPHLHFEVHLRGDASKSGATDPVQFMREHGATLGGQQ
jgi:murein DD-endopeptidase MepM/ murein hydrolase activator NlpD